MTAADEDILWAVDHAKRWMGTTVTQRALLRAFLGHARGYIGGEALDDALDDPDALVGWVEQGLRPRRGLGWPRLFPVRWHDHYTAWVAHRDGTGVCFTQGPGTGCRQGPGVDPHMGPLDGPRFYDEPPLAELRPLFPGGLTLVHDPLQASQRYPEDTLCCVWCDGSSHPVGPAVSMVMFFCDRWRTGCDLADAWEFLRECLRCMGHDFCLYARVDLARGAHDVVVRAVAWN